MIKHINMSSKHNTDATIKMENVSKKFSNNLKRSMIYGVKDIGRNIIGLRTKSYKLRKSEFWAVDDVSFEVKKGECLGIIGPNGSGKSTILKMLNGIYWPDKGKITVNGKAGALIEIGAGFHPMLTGRENIYLNASILGMAKEEVDGKFDDIIQFADIGDFIDTPVKFYSSGMFVRLGFSVLVHCERDILLVDEILAVGDAAFRRKSSERMKKFVMDSNKTVVLISHNMQLIEGIASKAILLDKGKIIYSGNANEVVAKYDILMRPHHRKQIKSLEHLKSTDEKLKLVEKYEGYTGNEIDIQAVWLESSNGKRRTQFSTNEDVAVCISYENCSNIDIKNGFVSVAFINEYGVNCIGARVRLGEQEIPKILPDSGTLRVWFRPIQLATSTYKVSVIFFDHTFTTPYQQGHYGYAKVFNKIPTRIPGENTALCWPKCEWSLKACTDVALEKNCK